MVYNCCVKGCNNGGKNKIKKKLEKVLESKHEKPVQKKINYHRFPNNDELIKEWLKKCNVKTSNHKYLK